MKKPKNVPVLLACLAALFSVGCASQSPPDGGKAAPGVTQAAYAQSSGDISVPGRGLADKLAWLQANAQSKRGYILELSANESIGPQDLFYSRRDNITITLRGIKANRTISLTSDGHLFGVFEGVTLILDNNITLQGRESNTSALVFVYSGAALRMNDGAAITDNTPLIDEEYGYATGGGGVYVTRNAAFTMSGGTISGNSAQRGGGVFTAGTFTMHSGTISDNAAFIGGGVYVDEDGTNNIRPFIVGDGVYVDEGGIFERGTFEGGTFTMSGGTISDNAAEGGGGVHVDTGGTFTMSDGTISGNSARDGGGVNIGDATFTMSGGTVSGNVASKGGGVLVWGGTFTMNEGIVSGNSAWMGGGVDVLWGTFTMSGGTVSGNSSEKSGGGVSVLGTFTKTSGTIYGSNAGANSNTAMEGGGHAVCVWIDTGDYRRESSAGPNVRLDSSKAGAAGGWE